MVTNRANSRKARLEGRWSSDGNDSLRFLRDASEAASLSDGLGLQHIRKVAKLCGMEAHLWQEHGVVHFTATVAGELSEDGVGPTDTALQAIAQFPPNMRVFCIDDSAIARESMACILPSLIPDSIVRTFGENMASVAQFQAAVLEGCDIAILDQHLDYPGAEVLGTSITEYLAKAGFQGLLCIRSANSSEGDEALYCSNSAHCQIGKDMLNHILKNIMAEAAGCIDLYLCTQGQDKVTHGTDILYRGMWWCKLREATVSVAEGEYESRMTCVDGLADEHCGGGGAAGDEPGDVAHPDAGVPGWRAVLDKSLRAFAFGVQADELQVRPDHLNPILRVYDRAMHPVLFRGADRHLDMLVGRSLHLLLLHSFCRSCICSDTQMLCRMQQAALRGQKSRRASEKTDVADPGGWPLDRFCQHGGSGCIPLPVGWS